LLANENILLTFTWAITATTATTAVVVVVVVACQQGSLVSWPDSLTLQLNLCQFRASLRILIVSFRVLSRQGFQIVTASYESMHSLRAH